MPGHAPRSRGVYLAAAGAAVSICALVGAYVLLSASDASDAVKHHKRKVLVAAKSLMELENFLSDAIDSSDDIYCTLLQTGLTTAEKLSPSNDPTSLRSKVKYLLAHEKQVGLYHMIRHISPELVIVLPSTSARFDAAEVKQWVHNIAILEEHAALNDARRLGTQHFRSTAKYNEIIRLT